MNGKTYQQKWEETGITYQEAQEWISAGFRPNECHWIKQWKNHGFAPWEVKSWMGNSLAKNDYKFAVFLKQRGFQSHHFLNISQLRVEFETWSGSETLTQIIYQQQSK